MEKIVFLIHGKMELNGKFILAPTTLEIHA